MIIRRSLTPAFNEAEKEEERGVEAYIRISDVV